MMARSSITVWILLCLLGAAVGCTRDPLKKFYVANAAGDVFALGTATPHEGEPRLIYGDFTIKPALTLFEDGYALIGEANFWCSSNLVSDKSILNKAKKLRAEIVLVSSRHRETVNGSMPITTPTNTTTYNNGNFSGTRGYLGSYSGTSRTYGTQTTYIPYTIIYMDYQISFWAKGTGAVFGCVARELSTEETRQLEQNTGLMVMCVQKKTPAFDAGLLPGDILMSMDGNTLSDDKEYVTLLQTYAGRTVPVAWMHKGQKREAWVTLNSPPWATQSVSEQGTGSPAAKTK
jgi:hypothetical protein